MATVTELNEKLDALTAKVEAEKIQVVEAVVALKTEIQALKDALNVSASPEQLQAIADKIDAAAGNIEGIYTPDATV